MKAAHTCEECGKFKASVRYCHYIGANLCDSCHEGYGEREDGPGECCEERERESRMLRGEP